VGIRSPQISWLRRFQGCAQHVHRETPIKVNSADPGYTATDLNGNRGTQTVEEAVVEPLRLALLDDNGPTGGFFDKNGAQPW